MPTRPRKSSNAKSNRKKARLHERTPNLQADQAIALEGNDALTVGIGKAGASSASARAAALKRVTVSKPARASRALLQLQRQNGNRYVQRAVSLGKDGEQKGLAPVDVEQAIQRTRGGGQALDSGVRTQMGTEQYSPMSPGREQSRTHELAQVIQQYIHPATSVRPARPDPNPLTPRDVLQLQYTIGNQTVGPLIARRDPRPVVQPESMVDRAGDQYPQPVDRVIEQVFNTSTVGTALPWAVGYANTVSGLVQRQEVGNQFYAHGAFMGAARQMLNDPKWNRILETLMPDVHADVRGVTDEGDLIPMLENNPVMAAYGMIRTQQLDQRQEGGLSDRVENMKAFEWDVFLDPRIVRGYRVAFNESTERELDEDLVDTMLIAHGSTKQTIVENKIGYAQYEAVKGTRKTEMGGTRPGAWMDLFGRAIRLATADNPDELMADMVGESRHTDEDDQSLYQTFERQMTFRDVIDLYKRVFGKETFSVLLDIKSRNAAPWVLRRLILELNRRGVHVYGVGTFTFSELNNLDEINQQVDGQDMGAPTGIKFFHGIGNLQTACTDGEVFEGDTVMFNAGSILDSVDWDAERPDANDDEIEEIIQGLGQFKNTYGFHLGLYVQEGSTDRRAARKIAAFSNQHSDIFDLGFGWGGISTEMGPVTSGGTGMGSQAWIPWNEWDEDVEPGTAPSTGFESMFSIKRFLESRHFEVKRGRVEVTAHATWDSELAPVDSYTITLRQSDWFRDTTYTRYRFKVGQAGRARWDGLEDGTYYLEIDVADQKEATLNGEVRVSF
jgi:hypothetical protein